MANTKTKLTIVIVPAAFSAEFLYTALIEKLRSHGYETIFIRNLTTIWKEGAAPTMFDDAAQIHSICEKLADDGKEIVLTMHSYGGVPGTESARGLGKKERQAAGKPGGIGSLVYCSALIPKVGQSAHMAMGGDMPDMDEIGAQAEQWMSIPADFHIANTFSDLPHNEAAVLASKMQQQSAGSFHDLLTYEAYKHIPVLYVSGTEDRVVSPDLQQSYIEHMRSAGGKVDVVTCTAGHCVGISQPEVVVRAFRMAAGERDFLEN